MLSVLGFLTASARQRIRIAIAALLLGSISIPGRLLARDAAPETGSITSISPSGMVTVATPGSAPGQLAFLVRDRALVAQLRVGDPVAFNLSQGTGQLSGRTIRITHMLTHPKVDRKPHAIQGCKVYAGLLNVAPPIGQNTVSWNCSAERVAATGQYFCRCVPTFLS